MSALDSDDIRHKEAYILYAQGYNKTQISKQIGVARKTIINWSQKHEWDKRLAKQKEAETPLDPENLKPLRLDDADKQFLQEQTISKGMRTLYTLMNRVESAVLSNQEDDLKVNIKTLVDALDKFYRLQVFLRDGGVDKKEVHVKKESIDWTTIIQESIAAKKEHGESFDEKEFLKKAMSRSLGKDN